MKINGQFDFSNRSTAMLPMLIGQSRVHLHPVLNSNEWCWYGLQKTSWNNRQDYNGSLVVLDEGVFIQYEENFNKKTVPLKNYSEFSYVNGHVIGVIDDDNYAFYDLEKKVMLFEGSDDDGVDELCFYSPEVHIYREYTRLVGRKLNGEKCWAKSFEKNGAAGDIHGVVANPEAGILFFWYSDEVASYRLYVLEALSGDILHEYELTRGPTFNAFRREGDKVYLLDQDDIWVLSASSGALLIKMPYPTAPDRRGAAFTQSTIALMHHAGELVILDKSTLNHLHTLDLGQGQYVCAMTGNKTGVAVRLVDKNAYRFNAAGYGLYLTDAQLLAGEMPDLTPEPLAATIEQQPAEGGYNLLVTINAGLTVADFLRHTSHALWQTPYQHASIRSTIDRSETRQGNPDFKGILTLNLTHAPTLTREQDQAVTAIVNGAKNRLGECVVDLGGENERAVDIVVAR
ncbi:YncE family protein [Marinagarivorans algicola]|uniref:hypothetical protein n=1 Tax=Marinagarivorans algicola TaxID=1513270 RepID=UPI0037352095